MRSASALDAALARTGHFTAVTVGDQSAVFTSGGYAFETDTGKLYYDADGDFTSGVVLVGTIYSGDAGTARNIKKQNPTHR